MILKSTDPLFSYLWDVILFLDGLNGRFFYADIAPEIGVSYFPLSAFLVYGRDAEAEDFSDLTHGVKFGVFSVH